MKVATAGFAAALLVCSTAQASAQSVSVQFQDGTVSLSARNAPLRTILAEWTRVGGSQFVNAERVTGEPLTLELSGVSEREALAILLRNVSGYIAAPRQPARAANASAFERILILPTSTASAAPPPRPTPQPQRGVIFTPGDPDENPAVDVPPDGFPRPVPANAADVQQVQRQLREAAARAEAAREQAEAEQAQPDPAPADESPARGGRSRRTGGRPFGNIQGSSRPGEITPPPQQQDDDDDDDPDER